MIIDMHGEEIKVGSIVRFRWCGVEWIASIAGVDLIGTAILIFNREITNPPFQALKIKVDKLELIL